MTLPLVTAVVPTRNRRQTTLRFLASMAGQTHGALRVVVVDANSSDGTVAAIRQQHPKVTVLAAGDRDFWAGATNRGVRRALAAGTDYVLTINDDAVVPADYVERMVALAQRHGCGILGSRIDLLAEPGRIWALGTRTDWGTDRFLRLSHHDELASQLDSALAVAEVLPAEAMPGNGVLIRQDIFRRVGLYDDFWLPHYHADSEWVMRAVRRGIDARVTPGSWCSTTSATSRNGCPSAAWGACCSPSSIPSPTSICRRWRRSSGATAPLPALAHPAGPRRAFPQDETVKEVRGWNRPGRRSSRRQHQRR